jgi:sugar lactone lactonase YvrE
MVRQNTLVSLFLVAAALVACESKDNSKKSDEPQELWTVSEGIDTPESVYFDTATQQIFVSNIAGGATDKDGRGWISRLSREGKVLNAQWVAGLNAPKGLRSFGDRLWVADIDRLLAISISQGKILESFELTGAKFLNDVTVDSVGTVFVSDMFDNKIYRTRLVNGAYEKPTVYLEGQDQLINPNGLLVHNGELIIGRWGSPIKDDFSTDQPGSLAFAPLTEAAVARSLPELGNIDGIELLNDKELVVSDFVAGRIYRVQLENGKAQLLRSDKSGTADIGLIPQDKILLVPYFNDKMIKAFQL